MSSIGIGGLIVGNAGAEEPAQGYVAGEESGVSLISPVSPVAPLEKSATTPSQNGPYIWGPDGEVPETVESDPSDPAVPSSPRSVEESADGSTSPDPARPTQVPSEPRPTGRPSESPSQPGESPSEPSESPSESPSDPSESPSEPSESPSESETGEPDPSGTPTD